jgi:2-polyprenyl-3-methyl-5-hydroxy-6-metoxy-1,4-benzoquinol methylase
MTDSFGACEICGGRGWSPVYRGEVRDGVFGRTRSGTTVARCDGCGVDRLEESACPDESFYETEGYRRKLQEELSAAGHYAVADELQVFTQQVLWPHSLRGQTVADIGSAGGSFLDGVAAAAARCVAVEPCTIYHKVLRERGYDVFSYAQDARHEYAGKVDLAVSIQVIEHVRNPRAFLEEIRPLLAPSGRLVISTPNRDDILMKLLPQDFAAFFHRVVHRWYFDAASLAACARLAGFEVTGTRYVHRYGMANALAWLRDRRPTGRTRMDAISPLADELWGSYLSETGQSDCLYMELAPASASLSS